MAVVDPSALDVIRTGTPLDAPSRCRSSHSKHDEGATLRTTAVVLFPASEIML